MTDMTLSGSIPGLLRRGSPIIYAGGGSIRRGFSLGTDGDGDVFCAVDCGEDGWDFVLIDAFDVTLTLDISDVTGRAHAAWWLVGNSDPDYVGDFLVRSGLDVLRFCLVGEKAATGDDLSDEDILLLRRVILYVAGIDDNG